MTQSLRDFSHQPAFYAMALLATPSSPEAAVPLPESSAPSASQPRAPRGRIVQEAEVPGLVRGYAALLKESGLPAEKVLVLLKEFVRTSIAPHLPTRSDDASEQLLTREELTGRAVTWCIDAYYTAADSSAGAHDETTKQRGAGIGLPPSRSSIRPPQEHHS